ncbi:hypothetical protein [Bacillus sp. FSL K6-3431]|uniref:hypothetical protein n=1 Tax=Bacillus sp. FSL K6-3431 TaxID=2921500 RepID=UPI0030FAFA4C
MFGIIYGITDYERSLFGDPLMDFVFGFAEDNIGFKNGYGRSHSFSSNEQCLLHLYNIYNVLLIIIEGHYRELNENDQNEQHARRELMKAINKVKAY